MQLFPIFPHKARFSRGRRPRPCWISVKTIYWSGDFQERFFLFDPSLTSGMSAALMQGHCLRRRPCIKQHMSSCREFHRKYHRQLPPHLTRHEKLHAAGLDFCWANVADSGPTLSWHFVEKLMNIQYLNHPPYPNRWMIALIQQGSVSDLESSEPGCQEDAIPYLISSKVNSELIVIMLRWSFLIISEMFRGHLISEMFRGGKGSSIFFLNNCRQTLQ